MRLIALAVYCLPLAAYGQEFDRIVIDDNFPGAYQVEVADINGDRKPDIVALGGGTCAWYENPTWTKRIITGPETTPGIITSSTADLDRDGKAEVAIGYEFAMNEPKKGKLGLAVQGEGDAWTFRHIADVGSIHRVRWADMLGDERPELVVAPIFGPEAKPPGYADPASLQLFRTGADPKSGQWDAEVIAKRPVVHTINVQPNSIFTADNEGVTSILTLRDTLDRDRIDRLVPGAEGQAPNRGASEIHRGNYRFAADPASPHQPFLVTIEPWHGTQVVVWRSRFNETARSPDDPIAIYGPRVVLDDTLDAGHALWVADIDRDGEDEVFAGHRGKDHRVSMYKFDPKAKAWNRTVIDRDIAAQDLRGGDLDGDGIPDVVAVGGSTHNVIWYRPKRP